VSLRGADGSPDADLKGTAVSAADRAIRISTAVAVLGVAGIAAYVSYWHAYEVVRAHGESGVTARLEPATIDGLVYASSMVVLYAARHQLAVPALARWFLAMGIVATLAANVAHGWPNGPIGAAVAAWPAASLVGSYELLLWLVRTAATGATARGLRLVPMPDTDGPEHGAAQGQWHHAEWTRRPLRRTSRNRGPDHRTSLGQTGPGVPVREPGNDRLAHGGRSQRLKGPQATMAPC
jgi:hypothetical protein